MGPRIPGTLSLVPLLTCLCLIFLSLACQDQQVPNTAIRRTARTTSAPQSALHTSRSLYPYHRISEPIYRQPHLLTEAELRPDLSLDLSESYGGIVSHHAITWMLMDQWFQSLKSQREISTFVILAPDHFNRTEEYLATSTAPWVTVEGELQVDLKLLNQIQEAYGIQEERRIFDLEHGIRTIVPYIAEHFPKSQIVPLIHKEHLFRKSKLASLIGILQEALDEYPDIFVITSVDFAHYLDIEMTAEQDQYAKHFLEHQWDEEMRFPACDNMGGLHVLQQLAGNDRRKRRVDLLSHSTSYQILGLDPDSLTSYFFGFYSGER